MEPAFSSLAPEHWLNHFFNWFNSNVLNTSTLVYSAMQIPALAGTGFSAWWVHDFAYPLLSQRIDKRITNPRSREIFTTLAGLIFPVLWLVHLNIAEMIAIHFGWPHHLSRIATNLLIAWTVIRVVTLLLRDPLWARSVATLAYTIAALNILHLLKPMLTLLDSFSFDVGHLRISILTIIEWMISFGVLLWIAILISEMLEQRISRVPHLTPSVQVLIGKLFKFSMVSLAAVISLASIGINLTALAVFSGALGVGIGFGLQRITANLLSGIMLLMDKSIKPGDIIRIGGTYGWVNSLGARYVSVETRDGIEFLIPNEDIITQQVENWSHNNDLARLKLPVRISYEADVDKALSLMVQAAENRPRVMTKPAPRALMLGFNDYFLDLELRIWIQDVHNGIRNISSEVLLEVWRLFKEHRIKVPIPRRELYHHSLPPALPQPFADDP